MRTIKMQQKLIFIHDLYRPLMFVFDTSTKKEQLFILGMKSYRYMFECKTSHSVQTRSNILMNSD